MTRMAGGEKTVISWQDAPDDLFFRATTAAKKVDILYSQFFFVNFHFNAVEEAVDRSGCQAVCSQTFPKNPLNI